MLALTTKGGIWLGHISCCCETCSSGSVYVSTYVIHASRMCEEVTTRIIIICMAGSVWVRACMHDMYVCMYA